MEIRGTSQPTGKLPQNTLKNEIFHRISHTFSPENKKASQDPYETDPDWPVKNLDNRRSEISLFKLHLQGLCVIEMVDLGIVKHCDTKWKAFAHIGKLNILCLNIFTFSFQRPHNL